MHSSMGIAKFSLLKISNKDVYHVYLLETKGSKEGIENGNIVHWLSINGTSLAMYSRLGTHLLHFDFVNILLFSIPSQTLSQTMREPRT